MPSPVGHFLGGLAVGWLAARRPTWGFLAICGVAAALPDADFLLPIRHRGASHSIGAAVIAGGVAFVVLRAWRWGQEAARAAAVMALAYATHVLFDWLGADSSTPRGLMALWPATSSYYISDLDVFNSVDRRYWTAGFWRRNAVTLVREVVILGPLLLLVVRVRRGKW